MNINPHLIHFSEYLLQYEVGVYLSKTNFYINTKMKTKARNCIHKTFQNGSISF